MCFNVFYPGSPPKPTLFSPDEYFIPDLAHPACPANITKSIIFGNEVHAVKPCHASSVIESGCMYVCRTICCWRARGAHAGEVTPTHYTLSISYLHHLFQILLRMMLSGLYLMILTMKCSINLFLMLQKCFVAYRSGILVVPPCSFFFTRVIIWEKGGRNTLSPKYCTRSFRFLPPSSQYFTAMKRMAGNVATIVGNANILYTFQIPRLWCKNRWVL